MEESATSFRQWSTGQKVCHVIMRTIGLLSLLAAACLLGETGLEFCSGTTIPRVVFMAMIGSTCLSLTFVIGTTPMPRNENIWGAIGTAQSCDAFGFLNNFGNLIFSMYDMFLSITYVLIVRYNWRNQDLKAVEWFVHPTFWALAMLVSCSAIATKSYGADWDTCWFTTREGPCDPEVESNCERGAKGHLFQTALYIFQIFMMLVSVSSMAIIYFSVKATEQRSRRHSSRWITNTVDNEQSNESSTPPVVARGIGGFAWGSRRLKEVGTQGLLYAGTTLLAFLPVTIFVALFSNSESISGWVRESGWYVSYLVIYLYELHGVFYLYVYTRKRPNMKTSYGRFVRRLLFDHSICASTSEALARHANNPDGEIQPPTNKGAAG